MIYFHPFVEHMKEEQEKRFKGRLAIGTQDITRNNGVAAVCLTGKKKTNGQEKVAVPLNDYYAAYQKGMALEQISNDIYELFHALERRGSHDFTLDKLGDFEQAKDRIFYRLVNYDKNLEMLKEVPHIPWLDLAVTFHVMGFQDEKGLSACPISHKVRMQWGLDIGTLYQLAKENTPKIFPVSFCSLEQLIQNIEKNSNGENMESEPLPSDDLDSTLYILTNQGTACGAGAVLYDGVLKDFADRKERDLVLLPSSIHEFLILPYEEPLHMGELKKMVEQINRTDVSEADFLSNHVYRYHRESKNISMI